MTIHELCLSLCQQPLLLVSRKRGADLLIKPLSINANNGFLTSVSCVRRDEHTICVAGGREYYGTVNKPLLVTSFDAGEHWHLQAIKNLSDNGYINTVKCGRSGEKIICVAAGKTDQGLPLIIESLDNARSWQVVAAIKNLPTNGEFVSSSCR